MLLTVLLFWSFYKKLRNLVNSKIRQESRIHNETRIDEANSDAELWRIASEVITPKKENEWSLKKEDESVTTDHQEVANIFNNFFIQKVEDLKSNIDPEFVKDPLLNLTRKNKNGAKFGLKTVSQKQLLKFLKKMKKKHILFSVILFLSMFTFVQNFQFLN